MWYFQFTFKCAPKVWMESSKIILEMDEGFNRSEVRKSLYYIQRGMFGVKRECLEANWKQFVKKNDKYGFRFTCPLWISFEYSLFWFEPEFSQSLKAWIIEIKDFWIYKDTVFVTGTSSTSQTFHISWFIFFAILKNLKI